MKNNRDKNKDKATKSVWDNYKCEGQYMMKFDSNKIDIVEEKTERDNTIKYI